MRIIAQSPTRISLFGGGTDVDPFASKYGGAVLNIAINIRQRVEIDTDGDDMELLENDNPEFIKSFLVLLGNYGVKHTFDGHMESGIGSSAALAVALQGIMSRLFNRMYRGLIQTIDDVAEDAWNIEVNGLGLYGGKQDQYCSAYGGVNFMEFGKEVKVFPLSRSTRWIEPYLHLYYTGENRKSGDIQEGYKRLSKEQIEILKKMKDVAYRGLDAIRSYDIKKVSELLNEAWELKKKSNKGVSNNRIDKIYNEGIKSGALAGKIMGAGGGGHILFICDPKKTTRLNRKMEKLGCSRVDFSIDWNGLETRII